MIDVQQVRELIELMVEHSLSEIKITEGETTISLRKDPQGTVVVGQATQPSTAVPEQTPGAQPALPETTQDEGLIPIKSPMVGTFYLSSGPGSTPFVSPGSEINEDTMVCIIEAMKVFNEIKAEISGTVERILVGNEQAIEYGQPLMLVRPKS